MNTRNGNRRSRRGFLLSTEDLISCFSTKRHARKSMAPGDLVFDSLTELSGLMADWPSARVLRVWNNIPGVAPIKKFVSHQAAVERIWNEIQGLAPSHRHQSCRLSTESCTTTTRAGRMTSAALRGKAAEPFDLPGWTISNCAQAWEFGGHVRLSPAPKAGGWAAKQLRFLSVRRGESVITDIEPGSLTAIRQRTGLPTLQQMWFHPRGFSLGYTKPRGASEPAEIFFFDEEARLSQQEYLPANVIEASAGADQWFIACRNGRASAFSLEGRPLWNKLVPCARRDNATNELYGLPIFHPRLQIATAGDLLAIAAEEEFHCYDVSGRRLWSQKIQPSGMPPSPGVSVELPTREQRLATLGLAEMVGREHVRTGYLRLAMDTIGYHGWKQARVSDLEEESGADDEQVEELDFQCTGSALQFRVGSPFTTRITVLRASRTAIVVGTQDGFVHEYDLKGAFRLSSRIGDAAVSDLLVGERGLTAAYCGGRLTLFDASRITGTTELPEYGMELAECGAGVLAWKRNAVWIVDASGRVQLSLETARPIRGAWGHATGFYAVASELVSFQLPSQAGSPRNRS
jgi:hypothetical protein